MSELRQFFVISESAPLAGSSISLSQEDSHHIRNVLRLQPGVKFRLIFQEHNAYAIAALSEYKGKLAECSLESVHTAPSTTAAVQAVLMSLCKAKKNEWVIEKATELGVEEIHFARTQNSEFKFHSAQDQSKKLQRWQTIAESAAKQSKRLSIPEISIHSSLDIALAALPPPDSVTRFVLSLQEGSRSASEFAPLLKQAVVAVGPEGDFTEEEYRALRESHFLALSLGNNILRAETAALAGIATINAISAT